MNTCDICDKDAEWSDGVSRYCESHSPITDLDNEPEGEIRCYHVTVSHNRGRRCLAPATGYHSKRGRPFPLCARHVMLLAKHGVSIAPIGNISGNAFLKDQLLEAVRVRQYRREL